MPEDIRFVLEAPNVGRTHKKRPRLVTSCDNCRMKKIKCLQKAPDAVCEACSAAGVSCRFRDRERYYAERSRMAAAAASSRGAVADRAHRDAGTMHNIAPATASTSHPPEPTHSHGGVARSPTKRASPYHPYRVTVSVDTSPRSSPESDTSSSPSPAPLFDPNERTRPNSEYMMNYIQVFFDQFNINFPFLAYDETIRQFFQHELSSLLANCIAAHAVLVQQSDIIPEAQQRRSMHIADQYCDTAKALVTTICNVPRLDTLHALILIAWADFKRERYTEFTAYGRMAVSMAASLGLTGHTISALARDEYDRTILNSTWTSINALQTYLPSQPQI